MSVGQDWQLRELPLAIDIESKAVLKRLPKAHAAPAELKGIASTIPNQVILIFDPNISDLDPLVKMAIIHFQFESIHPFYDGNGRTGRIIGKIGLIRRRNLEPEIII